MIRRVRSGAGGLNLILSGMVGLGLAGCHGLPTAEEKQARQQTQTVASLYRPAGERPSLSNLTTHSGLSDFLRFAMLTQPKVEAAYYDWLSAVQRITVERSLPDPRLTFSSDIQDLVMTVMPGLMMDFPGPGKLRARAAVASAESTAKYFNFEASVLQTAFNMKKVYYQLHFLEDKVRIGHDTLLLLADLERLARTQNEVGKVTLQDVLRAQIEQDRMVTEIANLEDSRHPLRAQFKAALGLPEHQPDPPLPAQFESTPLEVSPDQLLATALARNPRLRSMEAEVRLADAGIRLARKSQVPDFNLGLEADVKASPWIWKPQAGITLPLWRDKLAAEIAAAQAGKQAAAARLSAEQILLAVDFADTLFRLRESARNLELLRGKLIPKARQSLEVARVGYLAGQIDFFNLLDTERTLLNFELTEVEARTQRELALAELSLIILGEPPTQAPVLAPPAGVPMKTHRPH